MALVEIALGALCVASGVGVGWLGRGKYDAKLRADKAAKSERRKAGGAKAAATRKAKAEAKVQELGLVQKQQFQGSELHRPNGAVDPAMYGRGESHNEAA